MIEELTPTFKGLVRQIYLEDTVALFNLIEELTPVFKVIAC